MRRCDAVEVIRVGLALPVRRQRGTGHRGGAVLVPAAPHAEIDTNAPSARCAAAHFGVLLTTADRAVGSQYPPYASSIALPMAMPLVPLLSHLGAELGPLLLNFLGKPLGGEFWDIAPEIKANSRHLILSYVCPLDAAIKGGVKLRSSENSCRWSRRGAGGPRLKIGHFHRAGVGGTPMWDCLGIGCALRVRHAAGPIGQGPLGGKKSSVHS